MKIHADNRAIPVPRPRLLSVAVAACFAAPVAFALPTGPQVVVGSAAFSQQTGALTVTNTPGTIINWRGFSIGANEAARFIQQGPTSSVLNRVVGAEASAILGALQSNGRVWLVNPNGMLFGPSARIDVQGLVASTLAISNRDFLAGKLNFEAGAIAGGIQNQGTIRTREGGSVYLIAPDIQNSGVIHSPKGEVMLAAGRSVSLVEAAHPDVQMVVSAPADQAVNLGQILVEGGRASLFGAMLAQRGVVSASSVGTDAAGNIVFRAKKDVTLAAGSETRADGGSGGAITVQAKEGTNLVSGEVSAKGAEGKGGTIQLLGERVGLVDSASVDASGRTGGGTVLVGGDYQGKNDAVQNASATYVSPDATIAADAKQNGDGGKVIVWGDDVARVHGTISARGGAEGGDGGFVETSGSTLEVTGTVSTLAPNGTVGTWLLDPNFLNIASAGGVAYNGVNNTFGGNPSGTSTITPASINASSSDIVLQANTDVTFTDPVSMSYGGVSLTAQAGRSILVNNNVMTNNGNVSLLANDENAIGANRSTGAGGITIADGKTINAGSGTVLLRVGTLSTSGAISQAASGVIYGGTLTLNTATGTTTNLLGTANNFTTVQGTLGGTTTIINYGGQLMIGPLSASGQSLTVGSSTNRAGYIYSFSPIQAGSLTLFSSDGISLYGTNNIDTFSADNTGPNTSKSIYVNSAGPIALNGISNNSAGSSYGIHVYSSGLITNNAALTADGGEISLSGVGITSTGPMSANSYVYLWAGSEPLTIGGGGSVSVTAGHAYLNGSIVTIGAPVSANTYVYVGAADRITGSGLISAPEISLYGYNGIGSVAVPLNTRTANIEASNWGGSGDIVISNNAGAPGPLTIGIVDNSAPGGALTIKNNGDAIVDGGEVSALGSVTLTASGPLTINSACCGFPTFSGGTVVLDVPSFTNNAGALAISASNRWLIYSANPAGNVFGGLDSGQQAIWNATYASTPPDSVTQAGNRYLFAYPATLTFATGSLNKNYGTDNTAAVAALTSPAPVGLVNAALLDAGGAPYSNAFTQDTLATVYSGTPIFASAGSGPAAAAGTYPILPGGITALTGYAFANTGSLTVNPAALVSASLTGTSSKTYDGTTNATLTPGNFLLSGFVNADSATVTKTTGTYASKNAGSGILVSTTLASTDFSPVGSTNLSNYTLPTSASGNIGSISKANLSVTANNDSKTYNGLAYSGGNGVTISGFVLNETSAVLGGALTYLGNSQGAINAGSYLITPSGYISPNYNIGYTSGTLTIGAAPLGLMTASLTGSASKTYDGTTNAALTPGNFLVSGFVGNDSASVTKTTGTYAGKNVGSGILVSTTLASTDYSPVGSTNLSNYTLPTSASGNIGNIAAASLTVSGLTAQNKVYDGATAASVSGSLAGVITGDAVSLATGAFSDRNVGTGKPVTVSSLGLTGADAGNYALSGSPTTTADITVRPLSTWNGGSSGNWSSPANWDALPDLSNVAAVSVPAGTTVTYDAATGSTNLASLTAGGLSVAGGSLNIRDSLTVNSSFSQTGGTLSFGTGASASITQASGNLNLPAFTLASLSLNAPAGAIAQSGPIVAAALTTQSQTGTTLNNAGNSIASFGATNSGSGNVTLTNTGALTVTGIINTVGAIAIDNAGAVTTVGPVIASSGPVTIVGHSPVTIGAGGVSAGGDIVLTAGNTAGSGDDLTLSGPVGSTGSGSIALSSGDNLLQNANVTTNGGAVTAASQSGDISMALGTTTSTGGGSIGYTASGDIALTGLNAGSGAIGLNAGGDISSVPGYTGPNLIGGQALIAAGGNANLSTQVGVLDVKVKGTYFIADVLTGGVITSASTAAPALNQVTSTVVAATQAVTATTPQASADDKDKDKEDQAKKKQQTTLTTTTGVPTDVKPKNFCN